MNFSVLNPFVRSIGTYETVNNTSPCRAYDCRIIYILSGGLTVKVGEEKKLNLSIGNLLYIPAGVEYRLKGEYFRAVIATFDLTAERRELCERLVPSAVADFDETHCLLPEIPPFDKPLLVEDMESERDTLEAMSNIATSAEGAWRAIVSAKLKLVLIRMAETVSENALPTRMIESLDAYIRENCGDEISNTEIGAIFGYHPFYVSRMLKEKKGITMRQYIISYRLKAAAKMLELTKKSIAEIAEETGFTDASYFTKTFRATFGMTPKEWRNKFKEGFI